MRTVRPPASCKSLHPDGDVRPSSLELRADTSRPVQHSPDFELHDPVCGASVFLSLAEAAWLVVNLRLEVEARRNPPPGQEYRDSACESCSGAGTVFDPEDEERITCPRCRGSGTKTPRTNLSQDP